MFLLNELNQIEVEEFSISGEELEYILVENTQENRKRIDLALATQFNWAIVSLSNLLDLTAGGRQVLKEHTEEDMIDIAGIVWNELPVEITDKIMWSKKTGFVLND